MRILLLNQTFYPDQAATSQQLADFGAHLVRRGHEVTVLCDRRAYEDRSKVYAKSETWNGIRIHRVWSTSFGKRSFLYRLVDGFFFELCALFKLFFLPRQDLVVCFTSPPLVGVLGAIYETLFKARCVQWLMDINPDAAISVGYLKEGSVPARVLLWFFEQSLRHSSHTVVLDKWMERKAVSRGARADRVTVIPPWPVHKGEPPTPASSADIEAFKKEHGLSGKFIVLYSGNHSIVHPLDTLLEAARLMRHREDIQFLFIGGGLRVGDVTRFKEKHGLSNVTQLEHQSRANLPRSLGSANLHVVVMGNAVNGLVHTSKVYGILETGLPYVVIGPVSSHLGDVLRECPYGFQVNHGDSHKLVNAIERVKGFDDSTRGEYRRKNREFVTTHYGAEISLGIFEREILKENRDDEPAVSAPRVPGYDSRMGSRP